MLPLFNIYIIFIGTKLQQTETVAGWPQNCWKFINSPGSDTNFMVSPLEIVRVRVRKFYL